MMQNNKWPFTFVLSKTTKMIGKLPVCGLLADKELNTFQGKVNSKMLFVVIMATLVLASQSASQVDSSNLPLILPGRVDNTTRQSCPPEEVGMQFRTFVLHKLCTLV